MSDIPERDGRSEEGEKEPLWQSEGKIPEAQRRSERRTEGCCLSWKWTLMWTFHHPERNHHELRSLPLVTSPGQVVSEGAGLHRLPVDAEKVVDRFLSPPGASWLSVGGWVGGGGGGSGF